MPSLTGTVWAANVWHDDAWAANVWGPALAPVSSGGGGGIGGMYRILRYLAYYVRGRR